MNNTDQRKMRVTDHREPHQQYTNLWTLSGDWYEPHG